MRGRLRLNQHNHHIILCSSHPVSIRTSISLSMRHDTHMCNKINTNCTTSRISTRHNNHTLKEGVVETSEEEVEEESLLEGEVRLHAITVDNQVTMPEIAWNLQGHVHTVRDKTIMWTNVLS